MSYCEIRIEDFQLSLNIGVYDTERENKQNIFISLSINPVNHIKGMISDDISDTIDYHKLCVRLKDLEHNRYNLIEKLASDVFDLASDFVKNNSIISSKCNIEVSVIKYPKIDGLIGPVKFVVKGDL